MDVVISRLAVVSPLGTRTEDFVAGWGTPIAAGRPAGIPGFDDDPDFAPTKQVRVWERSGAMAVGAAAKLLATVDLEAVPPHRRSAVLGSALGNIESQAKLSLESLASGAKHGRPYFVDHKIVPTTSFNYTASQASIKFDFRGPSVGVSTGRTTAISALRYAQRLLRAGRADTVLAGAFEGLTDRRRALTAARGDAADTPGEGCCVFLLESSEAARAAGREPLATLPALVAGVFAEPAEARDALAAAIGSALRRAGVEAGRLRAAVRGSCGVLAGAETAALAAVVPGVPVLDPAATVGDTLGAAAGFGVAAALVDAARAGSSAPTLVTGLDPDGHVAAAVVRPVPGSTGLRPAA